MQGTTSTLQAFKDIEIRGFPFLCPLVFDIKFGTLQAH